jgi:hypothetical protein
MNRAIERAFACRPPAMAAYLPFHDPALGYDAGRFRPYRQAVEIMTTRA